MRLLQMSHDGASNYSFAGSDDEADEEDDYREHNDIDPLETRWQDFVKKESRKRQVIWISARLDADDS